MGETAVLPLAQSAGAGTPEAQILPRRPPGVTAGGGPAGLGVALHPSPASRSCRVLGDSGWAPGAGTRPVGAGCVRAGGGSASAGGAGVSVRPPTLTPGRGRGPLRPPG